MSNKEYKEAIEREYHKELLERYAGQAMEGLLGSRETNRRLTDGEILFLTEDAWKLARGMLVTGGYAL